MGSGLIGPVGGSVLLHVSHEAKLLSGLGTAPVLTPPLQQTHLAHGAKATTVKWETATICLTALVHMSAFTQLPLTMV